MTSKPLWASCPFCPSREMTSSPPSIRASKMTPIQLSIGFQGTEYADAAGCIGKTFCSFSLGSLRSEFIAALPILYIQTTDPCDHPGSSWRGHNKYRRPDLCPHAHGNNTCLHSTNRGSRRRLHGQVACSLPSCHAAQNRSRQRAFQSRDRSYRPT